jgi:prepilin-type N-terminal cleavage/methylation domain-containing protein
MKKNQGFTLIELLVVIAIIGVLSAVVLASLNSARSKGNDAAVQSNLASIQTQAEVYYGGTGGNTYGGTVSNTPGAAGCPTASGLWADTTIKNAVIAAKAVAKSNEVNCNSTNLAYAIEGLLSSPATTVYWCVDSTGRVSTTSTQIASGVTVCP